MESMENMESSERHLQNIEARRMSSVSSSSSTEEDDFVDNVENEEITKKKKRFAKRFQELKTNPFKKEGKYKEEAMGSLSDGEGDIKSKKRIGVMEKIRRFGSRDNLDDISKEEKENKKQEKRRGRRRKEEKEEKEEKLEDAQARRKRSKSREGALAFFDRFKGAGDDSSSDEEEFSQEFLKVANRCRKNHGLEAFVASKELNTVAHDWARALAKEQNVKDRKAQKYGKNIYKKELKNTEEKVKAEDVIYAWYQEINKFRYGHNPLDPDITKNATQLLWKDSRVVGIGKAKSSSKNIVFVAAYFSPRGNIVGQFAENVPPLGGFSPRLSKSDKQRESSTSDDEEKVNIQEANLEKGKESEKGKRKFFTHMFDKLRKNNESSPEASRKKDESEQQHFGYIGKKQGKYIVNQEKTSISSSHGNIYVASSKELEEAKNNLRSSRGESKISLEFDPILNRSKQFERGEVQKSEAKEDNGSSSSSGQEQQHENFQRNENVEELRKDKLDKSSSSSSDEEQHHVVPKRSDSLSNKYMLSMDQSSSDSLHNQPKEIHSSDCDITIKTENKAENGIYNADKNINVGLSPVKRDSLEELTPKFDHDTQKETAVYESEIKLIRSDTITISKENHEEKNISEVTHNVNEEFQSKMKNSSEDSSDSDESDLEYKSCSDSSKKPGIFGQVKTKVMRLAQSNKEESSEDEDKLQNKNLDNTHYVSVESNQMSSVTAEKTEVSLPVIQKENEPLYAVSFQFDKKEKEDTEVSCISPNEGDGIMSQAVVVNNILLENSNHKPKDYHTDSSSSDEDTDTQSSQHKTYKNIEVNRNYNEEIVPPNDNEHLEHNYSRHPLVEDEARLDTFEILPDKQNSNIEVIKTEKLKDDDSSSSSSSEEEEEEKERVIMKEIESDKILVGSVWENTNSHNENDIPQSVNDSFHEDSHINLSNEKHHNEKTVEETMNSKLLESSEVMNPDSRETLRRLSSSDNDQQRTSDSNNDAQRLFFDAVKAEFLRNHENRDHRYDVNNTVMSQEYDENEVNVNHSLNVSEKNSQKTEVEKENEEKLCSSDSDSSDDEINNSKHRKYPKSPETVHKLSQDKSHEDINENEFTEDDRDIENNNFVIDLVHVEKSEINTVEANQSETNVLSDSDRSEVKSSAENHHSSSDSDNRKKSSKPPIRRKSLKNLLQGIPGRKRKENSVTDLNQNKTPDSSDTQPEAHLNSSDSEGHGGKRKGRSKSFKNLFLDLSMTKKHDQNDSNNDENTEKPNVHRNGSSTTPKDLTYRSSISSKNSETESSDTDHKHTGPMKRRRKSLKDIFHDLKLTITHNTDSEKSGTTSPDSTISPTCDKGENKTPEKHKNESYISKIKHIFGSSENILQKGDNSERHPTNASHENEDYNKQECYIQVLEAINKIREKHNAESLTLCKELCDLAAERAENLASGIAGNLQNDIGENIFMHGASGTSLKDVLDLAVLNWYKTIQFHRFGVEEYNMKAGSFTQLVWRGSKNLGVGIHRCQSEVPSRIIIVALFSPAGNIKGKFIDDVYPRIHSSESESDVESPTNEFVLDKKMVCIESEQI